MKLVTFGCSWIAGDELGDSSPEYRNTHNLGYQIYKDYQFDDYINYGNNGASNERILIQLLEYTNSDKYSKDDVLVVGLSALTRRLDYINDAKSSLTIPHWDTMHFSDYKHNKHYLTHPTFKKWFYLDGYFLLNSRNELKRYLSNCLSIKSVIGENPCIVFQSIDNVDNVFNKVESWYDVNVGVYVHSSKTETHVDVCPFIDKSLHNNELNKNLKDTQIWLNLQVDSWETFLKNIEDYNRPHQHFASKGRLHPSELGIRIWYESVIKKYIDKIFGSLK